MQGIKSTESSQKAKRSLVLLGIMSIVMLFAGLTSGYIVRQGEGKWVEFALPNIFIYQYHYHCIEQYSDAMGPYFNS